MAAALIGYVYGICAGVIWAAYHEFGGGRSRLDYTPLVAADPTPVKLLPKGRAPDETAVSRGPAGQGAALADVARPASPTDERRRATARGSDAGQASETDASAAAEGADSAQPRAVPGLAADELMPEEWSVAAAPETRFEVRAAASRAAAPAISDEPPQSAPAAALSPAPALESLDVIPTEMAAVAPATTAAPETARRRARSGTPPRPSLKPIVMPSKARPDPTRQQDTRVVAARGQTLPEALSAFWTNLKILLASAPASSDRRVGSDGSDRWGVEPGAPGNPGDSSGDNDGRTDHAGSDSTGGNGDGGTSASGSGGGASSGGSSTSGSSGGSSTSGSSGGGSGSGGSTSSGASGGGGGNGGKGGNDKGGGGNANGGGKGGKGGKGGNGGGRGTSDDD